MPTRTRCTLALSLTLLACTSADSLGVAMTTGSSASSETTEAPPIDLPTGPTTTSGSTSSSSTTDDPTTTTTDATTGALPLCGNAVIDPGESCDLGWENHSDLGYCKTDCTLATCGDGDLWVGVEMCDEGPGGNLGEYAGCMPDCSLANFCGDGLLYPPETCDAGTANGTGDHEDGFVACSATCDLDAYRIFISSTELSGDLGGLTGADLHCQNLVRAAGWAEWTRVRAWLSDGTSAAKDRVAGSKPAWPYALVNGKRVADNLADLVTSGPDDGIDLDELGNPWSQTQVWTNTAVTGEPFSPTDHCKGWNSAAPDSLGGVGLNAVPKLPEADWKDWADNNWWTLYAAVKCNDLLHLYCAEF
jgi:hypothetical protein